MKVFKTKYLKNRQTRYLVSRGGSDYDGLFFNLEAYPELIDEDPSQPLSSQGSTLADSDVDINSLIEKEVPSRPKNALKDPSKLTNKYKREKYDPAYKYLQDFSDENDVPFISLVCHIGARGSYITDKKLAETFNAVASGYRLPLELPMDQCVYLKSKFADTQRSWEEFKWQFKGKINFPTYKKLNAHIEETMPEFIPFGNGWRFELFDVINLTLQRFPHQVHT